MWREHKIILTIFCGRQNRMEILLKYLEKLHETGVLDEVHLWDYCRQQSDREWLHNAQLPNFFKLFQPDRRIQWNSYYRHYYQMVSANPNDKMILIKCDDDVVAIDIKHFTDFLDFRIDNPSYLLVFPNTINNGMAAHFQQNIHGVIPKSLMDLEHPPGGLCGRLWESSDYCEKIHNFFLDDPERFSYDGFNVIPPATRFSINFFAVLPQHVALTFWNAGTDDEFYLSVTACVGFNLSKALYNKMYVSHLSFYKQEQCMNQTVIPKLLERYKQLAKKVLG